MGQVFIEWKGHNQSFNAGLWEFFQDEYLVDVTVTCHGHSFKVHKFVLALFFPALKRSLDSSVEGVVKSASLREINLDAIAEHAEDVRYLLEFVYTGKVTVPSEHKDCLMRAMRKAECLGNENVKFETKGAKECVETAVTSVRCTRKKTPAITVTKDMKEYRRQYNLSRKVLQCRHCDYETRYPYRLKSHIAKKHPGFEDSDLSNAGLASDIDPAVHVIVEMGSSSAAVDSRDEAAAETGFDVDVLSDSISLGDSTHDWISKSSAKQDDEDDMDQVEDVNSDLKCPHCDHIATKQYFLERHLTCHSGERAQRFTCKTCNKFFGTRNLLRFHRASKCGKVLPHVCKYCGHQTLRKMVLIEHMASKHKVDSKGCPLKKDVRCDRCNYICFTKHQLRRHCMSKHDFLNKFKCEECNYTCPFVCELKQHVRIRHQKRRDYMCDVCGYRSLTTCGLVRHVQRAHEGIKPYKCDVCTAEYSDSKSFKLHRQKHDGVQVRDFVCHICGQAFLRRDHLRTHCRCRHKVEVESANPNYNFVKPINDDDDENGGNGGGGAADCVASEHQEIDGVTFDIQTFEFIQ